MKCSKCGYLGFETGDRCKNCGYDFSLAVSPVPAPEASDVAVPLHTAYTPGRTPTEVWLQEPRHAAVEPPADLAIHAAALSLFVAGEGDDQPLVTLPAKPRAPLAVRRTPQVPKLRAMTPPRADEPVLDFQGNAAPPAPKPPVAPARVVRGGTERVAGRRVAAATIDLLLLFAVDATVIYFTLRMAGLTSSEWRVIPPIPLGIFLVLMKLAYFAAFTTVGGQTIGKMAVGIRVVSDDLGAVGAPNALRRTFAGVLAPLTLGLAYVPALLGADRRALHDRLAHTRVVASPSA